MVQRLVSAGHPPASVVDYTLGQIRAFDAAAQRQRNAALADEAVAARYAEHAENKNFEGFVDRLTRRP